eukprot:403342508
MKVCNYFAPIVTFIAVAAAVVVITVVVMTSKLGWKTYYETKSGSWTQPYDFQFGDQEYFYVSGLSLAKVNQINNEEGNSIDHTLGTTQNKTKIIPFGIYVNHFSSPKDTYEDFQEHFENDVDQGDHQIDKYKHYDLVPNKPSDISILETRDSQYKNQTKDYKCPKGAFIQDLRIIYNEDKSTKAMQIVCEDPVHKKRTILTTDKIEKFEEKYRSLENQDPYYFCGMQFKYNKSAELMTGVKARICQLTVIRELIITYDQSNIQYRKNQTEVVYTTLSKTIFSDNKNEFTLDKLFQIDFGYWQIGDGNYSSKESQTQAVKMGGPLFSGPVRVIYYHPVKQRFTQKPIDFNHWGFNFKDWDLQDIQPKNLTITDPLLPQCLQSNTSHNFTLELQKIRVKVPYSSYIHFSDESNQYIRGNYYFSYYQRSTRNCIISVLIRQ